MPSEKKQKQTMESEDKFVKLMEELTEMNRFLVSRVNQITRDGNILHGYKADGTKKLHDSCDEKEHQDSLSFRKMKVNLSLASYAYF